MSQGSTDKNNKPQQAVGDATDNSEIILDETGNIPKPGPRGMAKETKEREWDKENFEYNDK
jgi:hypothetical protein